MDNNHRPPAPADPVHRLYIDESGDHSYSKPENPWHKYLALLGVWFRRRPDYETFAEGLTAIKRDVFNIDSDSRLVLHRSEIKGRKGRFGVLKDEAKDKLFCERLIRLVDESAFTMVAVIIDKPAHKARYECPMHPYHYSMTALAERYGFWLSEHATTGDAMVEARGKREDKDLMAIYRSVATNGTRYLKANTAERVFTSKELKSIPKNHDIPGLQLADMLAHPMKNEALVERDLIPSHGGFARELAAAARPKYRGHYKGTVTGRGRVWL